MNLKKIFNPILPHLLIVLGFIALSYAYFNPVLSGKRLPQMDDTHAAGMAHELVVYDQANPGHESQWTNSMFGGMPSYLVKSGKSNNIFLFFFKFLHFGMPGGTVAIVFALLLGFYLLLQVLGFNRWLSIGGAIGFAFASFNILIISVGHITQAYAIAYMPIVIAGFILLFNKNYFWGTILTTIAVGLEIVCSHPQIAYYTFLVVLILFIIKLIEYFRLNELKHFAIVCALSLISVVIAIAPSTTSLWITYEYGQYSTRGKSELKNKSAEKESSGLDKDYALTYSYGRAESFSLLVPSFMGAGVNGFKENSSVAEELQKVGVQDAGRAAASFPVYWGDQSFRGAPTYFGAIICFLFVFGLFIVKKSEKWWLLIAAVLSIILAWGKNFLLVTDLFFYYFPGYSKFRTVEMIMVIANFAFPLLGLLAIKEIIDTNLNKENALKALKYSATIIGGLLLIFILIPGWFFDFSGSADNQLVEQLKSSKWPNDLINNILSAMHDDRASILRTDAFRSLFFVVLAIGLVWLMIAKKIKVLYFSLILSFLILIDLWTVDRRYLNKDNFVSKTEYQNQFVKTQADDYILNDPDPDYRVLNLARSVFNDAFTPYFHKSIGGYHGAKMKRYQDLIDRPLFADLRKLQEILTSKPSLENLNNSLKSLSILNMLNTKYIIYDPDASPITNS